MEATLTREQLLDMYYYMKLTRMVEERLQRLYRQGKIVGGLYRSLGQEGESVASAYALEEGDFLAVMIRNLGALFVRGVRPWEIFTQYMGKGTSPTRGKDNIVHFGSVERGIIPPISHLGDLIPVMAGIALASKMQRKRSVALTYIGDGGTSTGAFHEGLNFAAVLKLPLIVIAEDNGYAYSTPKHKQMAIENIADRAIGYGIFGETVDGNDVIAVYQATRRAIQRAREGLGPTLLEVKTFRMRGHAEHDDAWYVPRELLEYWQKRDPILRLETYLKEHGMADETDFEAITRRIEEEIEADLQYAEQSPMPDPRIALEDVYAEAPSVLEGAPRPREHAAKTRS
ncbi:MAG: thiamine pyrophosphate-dependent dehydrogenase E1 component subunit alpha [Blastocatellia bacterium]|nr:thiamine pyrophosphate-dependent dehydrogenase E1 component subunit alpha [Blastocatellia bacterium]MCS7157124.1 thiamine pyrophosphate-dependent dehydrogenase E1 component subunit alpha [Blastocatellia bacterium]MCX7752413.1 thiamine pyrophosphate-dependent dehydrogenase E1 component subunit alpha [Blastocatellia bacterium]MDW8167296.1 thiamine pyrophosphate-dependent dehydrogenase E1 component subunit alpha [Acidobacteriota bacterium]